MKNRLLATILLVITSLISYGQDCKTGTCNRTPVRTVVSEVVVQPTVQVVEFFQSVQPVRSTVVQASVTSVKTATQVAQSTMRHVGGTLGGARYEGVGFSTYSPEDALNRCCYSNRPRREQSVQYGYNHRLRTYGWFATILCD